MSSDPQNELQHPLGSGLVSILRELVRQLQSQPLVFGLGVILVLAIVGAVTTDVLSKLLLPALTIFVIGLVAWLIIEYPKAKAASNSKMAGGSVRVRARDVGEKGEIVGVEGLPRSKELPADVDVAGKRVEGRVGGVRYAREEKIEDKESSS